MAEFLTTHGTTARIEAIISKAKERLVLVSPFLNWSRILFERLLEADRRGVRIVFVYGKNDLRRDQRELLDQLDHLSLYWCRDLHAKCYFNEQQMVITSQNLLEYSERNNREMGVAFARNEAVYREALAEAQSILEASDLESGEPAHLVEPPKVQRKAQPFGGSGRRASNTAFCIRCRDSIPPNRATPLCAGCEAKWATWSNWEYEEKYCHQCGAQMTTCKARPLCDKCFWMLNSL